jgi:hypothetical protein
VAIPIHVDDLLIAAGSLTALNTIKSGLRQEFKMKDLGKVKQFLGMRILYDREKGILQINQQLYIQSILKHFRMEDATPIMTIMSNYDHFHKATADDDRTDQQQYQQAVGELIYASDITRPDITFYVNRLAQYMQDPSVANWNGVLKILRYLKGRPNYGIIYRRAAPTPQFLGYSDADYVAREDRRSISGNIFILQGGAVAWTSSRQTIVAGSMMESEYIALNEAGKTTVFLYEILQTIDPQDRLPITIYEDNEGTRKFAHNPQFHKRSKHIDTRYHYVRQLLDDNLIADEYIKSADMAADMLTKPLRGDRLKYLMAAVGIGEI